MCGFGYKKKREKSVKIFSLLFHRNARTIRLVSLRVRCICGSILVIKED